MTIPGSYWRLATVNGSGAGSVWRVHRSRHYPVARTMPANLISWKEQSPRLACCVRLTQHTHVRAHTHTLREGESVLRNISVSLSGHEYVPIEISARLSWRLPLILHSGHAVFFQDIALGCSTIGMYIVALMHAIVRIIPGWLEWRWGESHHGMYRRFVRRNVQALRFPAVGI